LWGFFILGSSLPFPKCKLFAFIYTAWYSRHASNLHMKIGIVGKGGSGKTTVSSLLARHIASTKAPVLAIDADINQHLARTLGMQDNVVLPPLGIEMLRLKEYVRGTNSRLKTAKSIIKTTPPGTGSRFVRLSKSDPIMEYFSREVDGVQVMAVGAFDESDLGVRCYHSKTGAVELLLNHLIDESNEYIVVDMTAGADSFASGLFTRFDITFLIVEPTVKSVSVYTQYKEYAKNHNLIIKVIGNKVEDETDLAFLRETVGNDLVALLRASSFIKRIDRGERLPLEMLEKENRDALALILAEIQGTKKDWERFYRHGLEFHIRNAESWANEVVGEDLRNQVDPDFDLVKQVGSV
jgi:CO dehydrogenase maturation factor